MLEALTNLQFRFRPVGGSVLISGAGTTPGAGIAEFSPTVEQMQVTAGLYEFEFSATLSDGTTYVTPWIEQEMVA